jgi:hypothetical protein
MAEERSRLQMCVRRLVLFTISHDRVIRRKSRGLKLCVLMFLSLAFALSLYPAMAQPVITIWTPSESWASFWEEFVLPHIHWANVKLDIRKDLIKDLITACKEGYPPDIVMLPVLDYGEEIELEILFPKEFGVPLSLIPFDPDLIRQCLGLSEHEEGDLLDLLINPFYLIDWDKDQWVPVGINFAPWLQIVVSSYRYRYNKKEIMELLKIASQWAPPLLPYDGFGFDEILSDIAVDFVDELTEAESIDEVNQATEKALKGKEGLVSALRFLQDLSRPGEIDAISVEYKEDIERYIQVIEEAFPIIKEFVEEPVIGLASVGFASKAQPSKVWEKLQQTINKVWERGAKPLAAKVHRTLREVAVAAKAAAIEAKITIEDFADFLSWLRDKAAATAGKAVKSAKDYIRKVGKVLGKKYKKTVEVFKGTLKSAGKRLGEVGLIMAYIDVVTEYADPIAQAYAFCYYIEAKDFWTCVDEKLIEQGLDESLAGRMIDFFKTLFDIDETKIIMDILKDP